MKNLFLSLLNTFLFTFCWIPFVVADANHSGILPTPDLIKALQSGGHIIFVRHAQTDRTQRDTDRQDFNDCDTQRNLSAEGREQAKRIGQAIKRLEIPVGKVSSSPYCRCKDTAKLIFGLFQIEPDLQFSISKDEVESKLLGKRLHSMMMNSEVGTKNVVFVGHTSNLRDGLGVWPKPEGVMVIFQKQGNKLVHMGMIKPDEWPKYTD